MHTLDRFHLPRVMTVTIIAAVLAIVLTLALATSVDDLASTAASPGSAGTLPQAPGTARGWNLNPFAPMLSAPARLPRAPLQP